MAATFTPWAHWRDRTELLGLSYPGVYVLAITPADISGMPFSWLPEIAYVGMTNAKDGLKSRLDQFDNTIKGREGHGGARRVRFKYPDHMTLTPLLYVAVNAFECDVVSQNPHDLRIMGEVARHEYECFARFAERFGHLPEFNDKDKSPKK